MRRAPPLLAIALATALFAGVHDARACSVCGSGDPLVAAGDSLPRSNVFRLALEGEYLEARARSDDDPALTEAVRQLTLGPVLVASPLDTLNLVLRVPVVYKDWRLSGGAVDERLTHAGLGDVDLGARWFFWDQADFDTETRQDVAVTAGTSLPTGPNHATDAGVRIDEHAQLGTGSFGPYAGLLYAYHRDPWNAVVSVTGRVHTTNSYGYRYGPAILFSLGPLVRPWERAAFGLGIDGRYALHDTVDGATRRNTGGLVTALTPNARVNAFANAWLGFRVQIPVYTRLFGVQHVGPTLGASLDYTFD